MSFRIGHGYDVHTLVPGRRLVLCGVEIPFEKGLLGHSDADAPVHALMDAILGALALGDIGKLFPDNDDTYKNISSMTLLRNVSLMMREEGFTLGNADITIIAEEPKLAGYIGNMRDKLSETLNVPINRISVKATTEEHLGLAGNGIGAHAVCLLEEIFPLR